MKVKVMQRGVVIEEVKASSLSIKGQWKMENVEQAILVGRVKAQTELQRNEKENEVKRREGV
jgi:hypothetical protein